MPATVVKSVAGYAEGKPGLMQGHAALWLIKAYQQVSEPLFLEISETYVKALVPMLEEIFTTPSSGPAKYGGNYSRDVFRAGFALMEVHRVGKHDWCLEMAEKIVLHAEDHPERGGCDWESLEPENCGNTILLCLDLYSATHDNAWLERALEKARYARSNLYSNGLFRFASEGPVSDRYCAYSDATLSYAFVRLAQALAAI